MCPNEATPQTRQVGTLPQPIPVDEARTGRILHRRVGASELIAGPLEGLEGFPHPPALGYPVGGRIFEQTGSLQKISADGRVERQFHLIDRDAVRVQLERFLDHGTPVLVRLAQHSGNQVNVDLWKLELPGAFVGPERFPRTGAHAR